MAATKTPKQKIQDRIQILKRKHQSLNQAIDRNPRTKTYDSGQIHHMKVVRLRLKDEIASLEMKHAALTRERAHSSDSPGEPHSPKVQQVADLGSKSCGTEQDRGGGNFDVSKTAA